MILGYIQDFGFRHAKGLIRGLTCCQTGPLRSQSTINFWMYPEQSVCAGCRHNGTAHDLHIMGVVVGASLSNRSALCSSNY